MSLTMITAPAIEPVLTSEAKTQCRVDIDDDDAYIDTLIATARRMVEQISLHALITQTWELVLDAWPEGTEIEIPLPPLQSVTSIKYTDEDSVEATFSSSSYLVDTDRTPGRIVLKSDYTWPSVTLQEAAAIKIRFVCGFGDNRTDVDQRAVLTLKLLVGQWYENREPTVATGNVQVVPWTVRALLRDLRGKAKRF